VLGLVGLLFGILLRPFTQFIMREYHDAQRDGLEVRFQKYAVRTQLRLSQGVAALLLAGFWSTAGSRANRPEFVAVCGHSCSAQAYTIRHGDPDDHESAGFGNACKRRINGFTAGGRGAIYAVGDSAASFMERRP